MRNTKLRGKIFLYIFVLLYPILPSYTRVLGYTLYTYLSIAILFILFLLNFNGDLKISKNTFLLVFVIFLLYFISLMFHGEIDRVFFEILDFLIPIILLLYSFKRCNSNDIEFVINLLIVTGFVISIFGLIEFFTGFNVFSLLENMKYPNPNFGSYPAIRFGVIRIEQSFNTALTYALYLMMLFILTFYKFFKKDKSQKKYRFFYLVTMILLMVNLFLTLSRGISLIFIICLCLLFIINKKYIGYKKIVSVFLFIVLGLIMITNLFPDVSSKATEMYNSTMNIIFKSDSHFDESNNMRENFQSGAIESLSNFKTLIFGVGVYESRSFISIDNQWLLELLTYGICGLIGFIIVFLIPIYLCLKNISISRRSSDKNSVFFSRCMLILILGYAIALYTVAQMADARIFYVIFCIICTYSIRMMDMGENENDINSNFEL